MPVGQQGGQCGYPTCHKIRQNQNRTRSPTEPPTQPHDALVSSSLAAAAAPVSVPRGFSPSSSSPLGRSHAPAPLHLQHRRGFWGKFLSRFSQFAKGGTAEAPVQPGRTCTDLTLSGSGVVAPAHGAGPGGTRRCARSHISPTALGNSYSSTVGDPGSFGVEAARVTAPRGDVGRGHKLLIKTSCSFNTRMVLPHNHLPPHKDTR